MTLSLKQSNTKRFFLSLLNAALWHEKRYDSLKIYAVISEGYYLKFTEKYFKINTQNYIYLVLKNVGMTLIVCTIS